jgi:hypothetical protein
MQDGGIGMIPNHPTNEKDYTYVVTYPLSLIGRLLPWGAWNICEGAGVVSSGGYH